MIRSFLALSLVSVIAGAPIATTVCQVSCAMHDMNRASNGAQRHSCHEQPSSAGAAINGVPHTCGHSSESQASIDHSLRIIGTPSIATALIVLIPPAIDTLQRSPSDREHRPRAPAAQIVQLRV
jgi:hypothetical protein